MHLDELVRRNTVRYGEAVIGDRALPDFRDGLLPVQRAFLWSMHNFGLSEKSGFKKSATIAGDTLGRFHPHNTEAIYDSMARLTRSAFPLVEGQGNFGSLVDSPAAMRYTEARLSKQMARIFNPDYLAVVPMMPNYTATEEIPLFFPFIKPFLLLNGNFGIAVALATQTPAFTEESVDAAVRLAISKKLTAENCPLKLAFVNGGSVADQSRIGEFFNTGKGSVTVVCDYTVKGNEITVTGVPDGLSILNAINKIRALDETTAVFCDDRSGLRIKINTIPAQMDKVLKLLQKTVSYNMLVLDREIIQGDVPEERATPKNPSVVQYIYGWVAYRLELEKKFIEHKISTLNKDLRKNTVYAVVGENGNRLVNIIANFPRNEALGQIKATWPDLTDEEARSIYSMQVSVFSKENQQGTRKSATSIEKALTQLHLVLGDDALLRKRITSI